MRAGLCERSEAIQSDRRRAGALFPKVLALLALATPAAAENYDRVLSAVTLSFQADGGTDRAVLVANGDSGADLYLYLDVDDGRPDSGGKPALVKKNAAWNGAMWGSRPTLDSNGKGALLIKSGNDAMGRSRWSQTLTVLYRNKEFIVAGVTREERDTLDEKQGGACDLNLLTGKGKRNGKPVATKFAAVKLADWLDEKPPKECSFGAD